MQKGKAYKMEMRPAKTRNRYSRASRKHTIVPTAARFTAKLEGRPTSA